MLSLAQCSLLKTYNSALGLLTSFFTRLKMLVIFSICLSYYCMLKYTIIHFINRWYLCSVLLQHRNFWVGNMYIPVSLSVRTTLPPSFPTIQPVYGIYHICIKYEQIYMHKNVVIELILLSTILKTHFKNNLLRNFVYLHIVQKSWHPHNKTFDLLPNVWYLICLIKNTLLIRLVSNL